jgi:hypothetical protein
MEGGRGLLGGQAMSLVQIAQKVSMAGAAVVNSERSGPVAFSNVPDIIDMGSVHVILLEQQIELIVRFRLVLAYLDWETLECWRSGRESLIWHRFPVLVSVHWCFITTDTSPNLSKVTK